MTDPIPSPPSEERRIAIENLVRRYLEQDDVWAGIEDWLTNAYEDPMPPVSDLLDRIAVIRPMPPLAPLPPKPRWWWRLIGVSS